MKFGWLFEPKTIPTIPPPANTPITWDLDGSTLSLFGDKEWCFPAQRKGSYHTIYWSQDEELAITNNNSAKALAILRFTNDNTLKPRTASRIAANCKVISNFCNSQMIQVVDLKHHATLLVDFFVTLPNQNKLNFVSLSRCAITHNRVLGWIFLNSEQINILTNIITLEHKQTPVIPIRISNTYQLISDQILKGFLDVADDFTFATQKWLNYSSKLRNKNKPGYWPTIIESYPKLRAELEKWCPGFNIGNIRASYICIIQAAAFWTIGMGSCARKSEILNLQKDCLSFSFVDDEKVLLMQGKTTKSLHNDKATWIVSPTVETAIRSLEALLGWYQAVHISPPKSQYLFQILDYTYGIKTRNNQKNKGYKLIGQPIIHIILKKLTYFVNDTITEEDLDWACLLSPTLNKEKFKIGQPWPVAAHQLRRTLLVHAAASGLVSLDSLAFQAKHSTWTMITYYCQRFWHLKIVTPDDPIIATTDKAIAEEFSKIYADSYNRDREKIYDDDRFFSIYGQEHKRQLIEKIPILKIEEIKAGIANEVLKRNTLGICSQIEYCEYQSAITVRGCMTKANGQPCAQAIIDSNRISELEALIQDIKYRLEELGFRETFEREQLEADIASALNAIDVISNYKVTINV